MAKFIYEYDKWPEFMWDDKKIIVNLGKVRHLQGKIFGQMSALGFSIKEETLLSTLTQLLQVAILFKFVITVYII